MKTNSQSRKISTAVIWKSLLLATFLGISGYAVVKTPDVVETVSNQRVEQINIEGEIHFLSEQDVLIAVNAFISESLLLVDMAEIKNVLEDMPWIRTVTIQRQWPDTMVLSVKEEKAIARWGEDQLLNQDGAIFSPENIIGLEHLARLTGPAGSERHVMEQYQLFNQLLYQRGLKISDLKTDARGAWSLKLENGVSINIGKAEVMGRMKRLVDFVDPVFMEQMISIESIDLRYNSGIAVKPKQFTSEEVVSL